MGSAAPEMSSTSSKPEPLPPVASASEVRPGGARKREPQCRGASTARAQGGLSQMPSGAASRAGKGFGDHRRRRWLVGKLCTFRDAF